QAIDSADGVHWTEVRAESKFRLLLKSDCFAGLGRIVEPLEADSQSIPNGPYVPVLAFALRPAAPAPRGVGRQHDDLVANVFHLVNLDADIFKRLTHRAQGVFVGRDSPPCSWLDGPWRIHVLDVGMQQAEARRRLTARQCLVDGSHNVNVLLRNTPSPRLQRWFERNALAEPFELANQPL